MSGPRATHTLLLTYVSKGWPVRHFVTPEKVPAMKPLYWCNASYRRVACWFRTGGSGSWRAASPAVDIGKSGCV